MEWNWPGKLKDSEKAYLSDTMATNPTWTALGADMGLHSEKPVANCLCYAQPIHSTQSSYEWAQATVDIQQSGSTIWRLDIR
jgi:hypothetical protein